MAEADFPLAHVPCTEVDLLPQQAASYVRHFVLNDMEALLVSTNFRRSAAGPGLPRLLQFEDQFYGRELAEEEYVWVKKRIYGEDKAMWSVKFLKQYQPLGEPLCFIELVGETLEMLESSLTARCDVPSLTLEGLHADEEPFLSITTSRLLVSSPEDDTHCWIDSSCRTGGASYYVSCGMRYTIKERAVALWTKHFGQLGAGVLGAPSKALVFAANIYAPERSADASYFIDPCKNLRSFNPLTDTALVLRLGDDVATWAKAWCEALRTDSDVTNTTRQQQLLEQFSLLANVLQQWSALDLLRLSPLELCSRLLSATVATATAAATTTTTTTTTSTTSSSWSSSITTPTKACTLGQYSALPDEKRLPLAGVCGLMRVWRLYFAFQQPFESIAGLTREEVLRFLCSTTATEMCSLNARLCTLVEQAKVPVPLLQQIVDYIEQNMPFYGDLKRDFVRFQYAVIGLAPFVLCL
jgi:hypothetical protein